MNNANDAFWLYYFALARCPPGILHFIRKLITILTILARPPGPFLTHRQRIIGEIVNVWNDRDIFTLLANNRYSFTEIIGETNKSLIDIVREIQELFHHTVGRHHTLFLRNRVMLFVLSLISYPSYHMLSALFDISVPSVKEAIHSCIPVFREKYRQHVRWPSFPEWTNVSGALAKIFICCRGYRWDINGNLETRNKATITLLFRKQTLSLYPHSGLDYK